MAKSGKVDRDIEKAYPPRLFVAKMRRLCTAITKKSPFVIQVAGERITVPAGATINIEHERSGRDEELEFQLVWRNPPAKKTGSKPKKKAKKR